MSSLHLALERRALVLEVGNQIAQRATDRAARPTADARPARALSRARRPTAARRPLACCSCESRSAADRPAGPPPTISTSTSSVSRLMATLCELGDQRRRDLEDVALNAVVGDLEDRRFGVLVDGDDRPRALHADEVLNRAGDAERDVELRRHRLTRAADLPLHRQPAVVADRPRRGQLGAERHAPASRRPTCSPAS